LQSSIARPAARTETSGALAISQLRAARIHNSECPIRRTLERAVHLPPVEPGEVERGVCERHAHAARLQL
jgi:hypothetical protein